MFAGAARSQAGGGRVQHLIRIGPGGYRLGGDITGATQATLVLFVLHQRDQRRTDNGNGVLCALFADHSIGDALNAQAFGGRMQELPDQRVLLGLCMCRRSKEDSQCPPPAPRRLKLR